MPSQILRRKDARARVGAKRTKFDSDFVLHSEAEPWVPGTDNSVPRLRPVRLGSRYVGFFDDEIEAQLEAFRRWRDQRSAWR
jgi:hypothetical protein